MSLDNYLNMNDEGYNRYVAAGRGEEINDPFHGSALTSGDNFVAEDGEADAVVAAVEEIDEDLLDDGIFEDCDLPDFED